ncbi:MAG: hypothetical protein ABI927_04520, partial [Gaiellaceae bacterium]
VRPTQSRLDPRFSGKRLVRGGARAIGVLALGVPEQVTPSHPEDDIPLPPFCGSYRVVPETIECWQGRLAANTACAIGSRRPVCEKLPIGGEYDHHNGMGYSAPDTGLK